MPAPISNDTRQAILNDIQAGKPRNQIAREHGVSASTVSKIAHDHNFRFDRSRTENATRARMADIAAQRAELAQGFLDDVRHLRERIRSQYTIIVGTREGAEIVTLGLPPLSEVRNAYTAIGIAMDKHLAVMKSDTDASNLAAVDAWLKDVIGNAR